MQWKDEIVGLWPTPILRQLIADESLLNYLARLDADQTSAGDDLFAKEDAAIQHLRETINSAVEAHYQRLGVRSAPPWRLRGWLEPLSYGESRALENVPGAYLSGVFFIRTPQDTGALQLRKDAFPGSLTLYDPRPGFNMLSIKSDPYRNQALSVEPQPGLLLMWPGFVNFYRHPNLSRTTQLCVRFDVIAAGDEAAESRCAPRGGGDIHDMWPTGLIKRRLPEHDQPNRELIGIIDELERENPDLTTDFNIDRFRDSKHSAVKWLLSHINRSVTAYFNQIGMEYPIPFEIASWPNINRFGDSHSPHNHPWCYLSGTYYIQIPDAEIDKDRHQELNSACISFYDPRSGMNPYVYPPGSRASRVHTVRPIPGALLLWPSAVYHFVHPNLSTRKRYSISFNIHLQWQDHYLA